MNYGVVLTGYGGISATEPLFTNRENGIDISHNLTNIQ